MAKVAYRPKKVVGNTLLTILKPSEKREETVAIILNGGELDFLIAALDYGGGLELTPMVTDLEGLRSKVFGEEGFEDEETEAG